MDVGAGDGRYAYERARKEPETFFIGLDPESGRMSEYSRRAAGSPKKGGLANIAYVQASIELPPDELREIADEITVILPWGKLLSGILGLEENLDILSGIAYIAKPGAGFYTIFSYYSDLDKGRMRSPD